MIAVRSLKALVLPLVLLSVAACQSSGTLDITEKSGSIEPGRTVAVKVAAAQEKPDEDTEEVMRRLRSRLFGRLMGDGVFRQVVHQPAPADYKMDITVESAREVSTGARIFLGVFAGSNNLALSVVVQDQTTGQVVSAFDVSGESAAHPLSTEAGLDDAIREAVDNVLVALQ